MAANSGLNILFSVYVFILSVFSLNGVYPLPIAELIVALFQRALSLHTSMMSQALGGLLIKLPISIFASAAEVEAHRKIETRERK